MNISIDKKNILINNKVVFTRKYSDLNYFNQNKKKCVVIKNDKKLEKKKLPAPLWCINELNGCMCNKKFSNPYEFNLHQEFCIFDENNLDKLKDEEESPEEKFYDFDDETIDIIESYERMTGNNILLQYLLGQISFNTIDNLKNEYYKFDDYDEYTEDDLYVEDY